MPEHTPLAESRPGERRAALAAASELSDEEVVRRVCAGETGLFEVVMRRHNQRVFRVARAIVGDDAEAEDVMQQAYVNAFQHLLQFEGRARFATWLTRIAANEAKARLRRRRSVPFLDPERDEEPARGAWAQPGLDPEQWASIAELRGVLESAIASLPDGHRTVFVLREVEGLSTQETAASLDLSEDVVKTRLHRARARLRAELLERLGLAAPHVFEFHLSRCDRVVEGVFARLEVLRQAAH